MKKTRCIIFSAIAALALSSCSPVISVKAAGSDGADISFKTDFTESTAKTLRSISGLPANSPIFSEDDMKEILTQSGVQKARVKTPSPTKIESSGSIASISATELSKANILKRGANELSITIGPEQIKSIYSHLGSESQLYFDMMLVPCLIGEEMDAEEYRSLLSSMYGPTFASELVDGKIAITLASPDGKKTKKVESTLGEILTLTEEKNWTLTW